MYIFAVERVELDFVMAVDFTACSSCQIVTRASILMSTIFFFFLN